MSSFWHTFLRLYETSSGHLEAVLKRDRIIVTVGLFTISALAWAYITHLYWQMRTMGMDMAMPQMQSWGIVDLVLLFVMWTVMMVAMMIPSASPMVLLFATVNRKRLEKNSPFVPTGVFLLGYVAVWIGFSALATLAQWGLHTIALLSPMMVSTSPIFGGALLLTAGIYQLTPLKAVCLHHCRSPLHFLMNEWQEGTWGAFFMGLKHGIYCVGCCWFLMGLLFVIGVMNLFWVAIIAAFILLEKLIPSGQWLSRIAGLLLIVWGIWTLAQYFLSN